MSGSGGVSGLVGERVHERERDRVDEWKVCGWGLGKVCR